MLHDKRVRTVNVFVGLVSVAVTMVVAAFVCERGVSPDGIFDLGGTVLVAVVVGHYLTRRMGTIDEDDRAKRSFAVQGIPKVRDCLDSLSVILDNAVGDDNNNNVFPILNRSTKRLFRTIEEEVTLLESCLGRIVPGDTRVTRTKLTSILEQRKTFYSNWSDVSGSTLDPTAMADIQSKVNALKKDVVNLYYDIVSRG